ncbi:hypothetical protein RND71_043515 [Anisodus tanguticus]|uniref:Replication factor C C-terminal domain-containing protein n=1 Tax=Anisodus tanguticus TaxID=243964 RepID=A0AAE1QP15_9SOLA|nr:hypothetical protein RND71_043515 [Anisodus tanguticus]
MTDSAQSALRRIMELESKSTRFCLICNYITRIIEPIASRCAKFRFNTLDQDCVIDKLQNISDLEGIQIENRDVLVELCNLSGGDLRKAINILQTALKMKKNEEKVTIDDLHEICGHIPPKIIKNIIDVCKEKSFQKLEKAIKDLIYEGYSAHQLLIQLNDWIENENCYLNDKKKSVLAEKISKADQYLLEGSNEYLQTLNVCSTLISIT